MIRHFVHMRFPESVSRETKLNIYAQLAALTGHIDGIIDFQHRENVSIEAPVVRGFNDMFWFDFESVEVRNTYLDDTNHKAVGAQIVAATLDGPDGVFVCDIEV